MESKALKFLFSYAKYNIQRRQSLWGRKQRNRSVYPAPFMRLPKVEQVVFCNVSGLFFLLSCSSSIFMLRRNSQLFVFHEMVKENEQKEDPMVI